LNHPYDLAFVRYVASALQVLMREPEQAEAWAAQTTPVSDEQGFPLWAADGRITLGWARAHRGRVEERVALIREDVRRAAAVGTRIGMTAFLTRLAEALAVGEAFAEALATIEDALRANPEEVVYRSGVLYMLGTLRLRIGEVETAEADFRKALTIAHIIGAKSYEIRAATTLARLMHARGEVAGARELLAPLYASFNEGFDTSELKDAKALLSELTSKLVFVRALNRCHFLSPNLPRELS